MYENAVIKIENVYHIKKIDRDALFMANGYPTAVIYGTLLGDRRTFGLVRKGRNTGVPIYEIMNG